MHEDKKNKQTTLVKQTDAGRMRQAQEQCCSYSSNIKLLNSNKCPLWGHYWCIELTRQWYSCDSPIYNIVRDTNAWNWEINLHEAELVLLAGISQSDVVYSAHCTDLCLLTDVHNVISDSASLITQGSFLSSIRKPLSLVKQWLFLPVFVAKHCTFFLVWVSFQVSRATIELLTFVKSAESVYDVLLLAVSIQVFSGNLLLVHPHRCD